MATPSRPPREGDHGLETPPGRQSSFARTGNPTVQERHAYTSSEPLLSLTVADLNDLLDAKLRALTPQRSNRRIIVTKKVRDTVHAVVKSLEKLDQPVTWNFSQEYREMSNMMVKDRIFTGVENKIGQVDQNMLNKAIRSYFQTRKAHFKKVKNNTLTTSRQRQRRLQRQTNKRLRRIGAARHMHWPNDEKATIYESLNDNSYISSEESEELSDTSDDDSAGVAKAKGFVTKPLQWRSSLLNEKFAQLDKKAVKLARRTRGGAPTTKRRVGEASRRMPPEDAPEWAVATGPLNSEDEDL